MRTRFNGLLGLLLAIVMTAQGTLPALAAPPAARRPPSTSLFPSWYSTGPAGPPTALAPAWFASPTTTLAITKSATPDPVDQGGLLTYIIAVSNEMGNEARRVEVVDPIPAGAVFESASVLDDGGTTWFYGGPAVGESGDFAWFTGDRFGTGGGLPGNRTALLKLVVRIVGPFPPHGTVCNDGYHAKAANAPTAYGPQVTTAVNGAPSPPATPPTPAAPLQTAEAQSPAQSTTLAITKSDSPDPVDQEGLLTYVITVTNQTANEAQQAVVTDTTPSGTVFESASVLKSGGATWFYGGPAVGESGDYIWFTGDRLGIGGGLPGSASAVLKFVVRVVAPSPDQGLVHNDRYYADAANADPVAGADVTTTVNAPAFALAKVPSGSTVVAGERLTYTINLNNYGHLTTTQPYTIVEALPPHTAYAASSPAAQESGGTLTWTLSGPLGPGGAVSVTFAVTVTSPLTDGLDVVNDSYLAFSDEVTPTAQGAAVTTTVESWPTLSISKAASSDPVQAGDLLTYTLTVTNDASANGPAQGAVITDRMPLSSTLVSAPGATWSGTGPGSLITWTLPSFLWPGDATNRSFTILVHSPLVSGTLLTNNAAISATNANGVVDTSLDTKVNSAPALAVTKSVYPAAATAGSIVTYTVILTNSGNETASGAVVTDTLPGTFTFGGMVHGDAPVVAANTLTWTGQTITGSLDTITPTGWVSPPGPLTLVFTATTGGSGIYYNSARVMRGTAKAGTGPTAPVFVGAPDLRLSKSDDPDPAFPGQPLTYTITYSNASPVPATSVLITDTLPQFITGGAANPSPDAGVIAAGQVVTWDVGTLASNSSDETITLVVTLTLPIADGTVLTNTASIYCAEGVRTASGPITTVVSSGPNMALTKSATPGTLSPNDTVTYTLLFSNTGTAATPTVITDSLPVSLTNVLSTTTGNVSFAGSTPPVYTWTVGTLAPGQQGAITITAQVMTTTFWGQTTIITNTAGITATGDSAPGNNGDIASVVVVPGPPAVITLTATPSTTTVDCSSAITAEVRDAWGNDVANGTAITFTTSTIASHVSPVTGSAAFGYAATDVTSTLPGAVIVTATAPNLVSGSTSVGFEPGAPFTFTLGPIASPQTAGVAFTVDVTATDRYGNVSTGFTGTVTLTDSTGTISPRTSNPASGGVLTQSVTITRAAANVIIGVTGDVTAVCGGSWTASGNSAPFTVTHNQAVTLVLTPRHSTVAAGNTLGYTADATDTFGNGWAATGEVTFTTSGGNGFPGLPPGNNVFSATTQGTGFPVTGTIAGAGGPLVATTDVTVVHGTAATVTIRPLGVVTTAGMWITYTADATDVFGNNWVATGDVTFAASGGNLFFGNVLSATVAGTWEVTGTLPNASDSTTITINPGPVASLGMGPVADPQTAGVGFGLTITAYDAFDNVVSGFGGNLNLADTTGTLVPTTWNTWSGGVANPVATVFLATTNDRITATLAATPTIWAVSNPFDVVGNKPTTVTYETPASLRLCEHAPVTVTVTDQYNNPVADGTVVTLTADGVRLWFQESGSFDYYPTTSGGVAVATLVAGNIASPPNGWTLAEAGTATSGIRWVSVVTPGVPYAVNVVAVPSTIVALTDTALITATVYDCAAVPNPVPGETVNFAATLGTVAPPTSVTDGNGQASTAYSSTLAGISVVTATVGEVYGLVTITVNPPENLIYLPLVLRNHNGVNLIVESIVVEPASPAPGEPLVVTVTIHNSGTNPVDAPFWVDLYLDPSGTVAPGTRWDQVCTEGVAWQVASLGSGQSLALRSDQGAPAYTFWTGSFGATPDPHKLYAAVDVWPGTEGAVTEDREDDNVLGPVNVTMGP